MRVTVQEGDRSNEMFISTRCRSLDDFISMFGRYVDGNAIFVATLGSRPEGLEAAFRVQLADGANVLRGRGVIRKVWTTGDNPFRLPGMLLEVRALTPRSKQVFDRMRRPLQVTGVEVVRPRHIVTIPPKQPRTDAPVDSTGDSELITRRYRTEPSPRAADAAAEEARGAPAEGAAAGIATANPLASVSDDELSGFIESSAIAALDQLAARGG